MTREDIEALRHDRWWNSRPDQLPPEGDWKIWLLLAGRGGGKTYTGAQQVIEWAEKYPGIIIHLVAKSTADTRDVMVDGPSGILALSRPNFMPIYEPTNRSLDWPNGSRALVFSAEKPAQLRGPQCHCSWGDEVCHWPYEDAFVQMQIGTRLPPKAEWGPSFRTQIVLTSTPLPTRFLKSLMKRKGTRTVTFSTYDNAANLSAEYLNTLREQYEGTRLGRQELHAVILTDMPGALWNSELLNRPNFRIVLEPEEFPDFLGALKRVIIAVDPSVKDDSNKSEADKPRNERKSDECGMVAMGVGLCDCKVRDGSAVEPELHGFLFRDLSDHMSPERWGRRATDAYREFRADRVIGEINNGGGLVEVNVRVSDPNVSYEAVSASRGKEIRAEPISALYEKSRMHHVTVRGWVDENSEPLNYDVLEDELTGWDPMSKAKSPNRLDALVWGATKLMLNDDSIGDFGTITTIRDFPEPAGMMSGGAFQKWGNANTSFHRWGRT